MNIEELEQELEKYHIDYEKVKAEMPSFLELVKNSNDRYGEPEKHISYITADPTKKRGVILRSEYIFRGSAYSGGVEGGTKVLIYQNGDIKEQYFKWLDERNSRGNRPELNFNKAEIVDVNEGGLEILLESEKGTNNLKKYVLKIKENDIEFLEIEQTPQNFEQYVEKEMDRVVKSYKKYHPEYQQTQICQSIIDKENNRAAFVLFEQIDIDAWLGNQFRYSVWIMQGENKSERIYEDHAYSKSMVTFLDQDGKGRDPSIELKEILNNGVNAEISLKSDKKTYYELCDLKFPKEEYQHALVKISLDGKLERL
jgi:hypothetical protein